MTELSPLTWTGVCASLVEPLPSWPKILAPQVQTVPSDFLTTVPRAPPQMETTSAQNTTTGITKISIPTTAEVRYFIGASIFYSTRLTSHQPLFAFSDFVSPRLANQERLGRQYGHFCFGRAVLHFAYTGNEGML